MSHYSRLPAYWIISRKCAMDPSPAKAFDRGTPIGVEGALRRGRMGLRALVRAGRRNLGSSGKRWMLSRARLGEPLIPGGGLIRTAHPEGHQRSVAKSSYDPFRSRL